MIEMNYNSAIRIQAAYGFKFINRVALADAAEAHEFIQFVEQQLDTINALRTGYKLMRAMQDTGKLVTIYLDKDRNGSAAVMEAETGTNDRDRFIKAFRPPSHRVIIGRAKLDNPLLKNASTVAKPGVWKAAVARGPYLEELTAILDRAGRSGLKRDAVAALVGLSRSQLDAIESGAAGMDDDTYFKFAFYLYAWLTPGPGINTAVRFDAAARPKHDGPKPEAEWGVPVPHVNLAHELIHALRMMQGMRIAEGQWGEEAMTVGLPPFTSLPFTENKIRAESNLSIRTQYGQSTAGSPWLDRLANKVETAGSSLPKGQLPPSAPKSDGWKAARPRH